MLTRFLGIERSAWPVAVLCALRMPLKGASRRKLLLYVFLFVASAYAAKLLLSAAKPTGTTRLALAAKRIDGVDLSLFRPAEPHRLEWSRAGQRGSDAQKGKNKKRGKKKKDRHRQLKRSSFVPARQPDESTRSRKVLWVDHYSEQMGRAASNFADLISLAKVMNRSLVEPYVFNSRMSGLETRRVGQAHPFSYYYDTAIVNRLLVARGFKRLLTMEEMYAECPNGFDVVVQLVYTDKMYNMRRTPDEQRLAACRKAAQESPTATADCPALVSLMRARPRPNVMSSALFGRGVVVDVQRFHDPRLLESDVMLNEHCAEIVLWAGQGRQRAEFDLSEKTIYPVELRHSERLLDIADKFVRERIGGPYVGVHIRAEKEKKFGLTVEHPRQCLNVVKEAVTMLRTRVAQAESPPIAPKEVKVFFTCDLYPHGSDTITRNMRPSERAELLAHTHRVLEGAIEIDDQQLDDNGAQAIVEMHAVSEANAIVVMGGGNFQEWIVSLFKEKKGRRAGGLIHRVCANGQDSWVRRNS